VSARVQRLRAELTSDLVTFERQLEKLRAVQLGPTADEGSLTRAAVALHHGYCALEGAFLRIMRELGEGEPAGPDWNMIVLVDMGLEIAEVRPAVLTMPTIASLRQLLGFRHFFRHAYAVDLDGERLAALQSTALTAAANVRHEIETFDAFLSALAAAP
jgi:hypothetical protein